MKSIAQKLWLNFYMKREENFWMFSLKFYAKKEVYIQYRAYLLYTEYKTLSLHLLKLGGKIFHSNTNGRST